MKTKTTLTIIFSAIFYSFIVAQNTTIEEYNWMSKGYKTMISSGLDMKKGYYFDDANEYADEVTITGIISNSNYSFTYKFLRRTKDKTLAGIVIILKSSVSGNTYYYGLPIGDLLKTDVRSDDGTPTGAFLVDYLESEYMQNFLSSIKDLDSSAQSAFLTSLFRLTAQNSMLYLQ